MSVTVPEPAGIYWVALGIPIDSVVLEPPTVVVPKVAVFPGPGVGDGEGEGLGDGVGDGEGEGLGDGVGDGEGEGEEPVL